MLDVVRFYQDEQGRLIVITMNDDGSRLCAYCEAVESGPCPISSGPHTCFILLYHR